MLINQNKHPISKVLFVGNAELTNDNVKMC